VAREAFVTGSHRNNKYLVRKNQKTTLPMYWTKIKPEHPDIVTGALKTLLPFPTSYLCVIFCSDSSQDNITKQTGHMKYTAGVTVY